MFIETISGDKLYLNIETEDPSIIKKELHKKYGYAVENMFIYWTGKNFVLGFFNKLIREGNVNKIAFEKKDSQNNTSPSIIKFSDTLKDKNNLKKEERKIVCDNLDEFVKQIFPNINNIFN